MVQLWDERKLKDRGEGEEEVREIRGGERLFRRDEENMEMEGKERNMNREKEEEEEEQLARDCSGKMRKTYYCIGRKEKKQEQGKGGGGGRKRIIFYFLRSNDTPAPSSVS